MITATPPTPSSSIRIVAPTPDVPLTATETVFEKLLADIVGGTYPAGARLPAERDLAKQLGASRPTLREALRRLGEWNLVKPRRGSGIAVQAVGDWMIDVLPSYLRYAEPGPEAPSTPVMVKDLLQLRRSLMCEILSMVSDRIRPEITLLARQSVRDTWENRVAGTRSPTADLNVLRSIVQNVKCLPGLWMLNQMSGIYNDLAKSLGAALAPPESYVAAWDGVLDALEAQKPDEALSLMNQYLEGHDERLMALLELIH
ncbi:MAG: FadR family transcriptional regulator [Myxococcales bacterium]|nr:FadR family transcriptional regulator [Myxococcales bacterium]